MVAEVFFHCCKHGHPWTAYTTMICNGRRRCRVCHNRRTNAYITKRYRTDPVFRKKRRLRENARYHRNKEQRQ